MEYSEIEIFRCDISLFSRAAQRARSNIHGAARGAHVQPSESRPGSLIVIL